MFESGNMPSLSDIAAVTNNDGIGGNNGWWILIILFAIFGGWGNNNYANNGSNGVADNYVLASDFANIQRQIDSSTSDIKQSTNSIANGLSSLGYDQLAQMNGINTNINAAQNNLMAQLNAMAATQAQCCCENKYLAAQNTASIIESQNNNTQRILDKLCAMETNALQDRIAALSAENQNLKFAASQQAQNAYLISQLGNAGCGCYGRNA